MPQRIEVPGHGIVEFPDGMSDDAISAAIKANLSAQPVSTAPPAPEGLFLSQSAPGLA